MKDREKQLIVGVQNFEPLQRHRNKQTGGISCGMR